MPLDLAGLRVEREHRAGIEIVAGAHGRVERSRIADAPIDRVQLRIIRAGDPGRSAAQLPGVALPGIAAGLIGTGDRIGAPQMLAGRRIPSVDETAGTELGAGDAGQDDAVRDQRRHRHRIALLDVGRLLSPKLLACRGIERDHVGIERGAEQFAVVDRGTPVDDTAAHDPGRFGRVSDLGLPYLFAGLYVDRHGGGVGRDIKDALVDDRLRLLASIIGQAVIPNRNQILGGVLVDLRKRTEPLQVIAHTVIEHVRGVRRPLDQLIGSLRTRTERSEHSKACGKRDAYHTFPPNVCASIFSDAASRQSS